MKIGVLALQGAFAEHIATLEKLKAEAIPVRLPHQLEGLDGLIIPGGESTTITKLMVHYKLKNKIIELARQDFPIFGTCAGMIILAGELSSAGGVKPTGVMDIKVNRNAFGRQVESFESEISIPAIGKKPIVGVFIRAPLIESVGKEVEILARLSDGAIVAARQSKLLVCSFHPELTDDTRFHQYFLDIVRGKV
ncbi:MAG TPA: pyridoxal 5'-phosphate synthase glutaminase subunit PdxT [Dehalococcoidales bacterium]|jgi:5'-phosphate synthase pdxT subunit|nr:pyridoxal 5'-phosphate synthase glutaminase subunit PdxT [Dehalococcoidales bacterium]